MRDIKKRKGKSEDEQFGVHIRREVVTWFRWFPASWTVMNSINAMQNRRNRIDYGNETVVTSDEYNDNGNNTFEMAGIDVNYIFLILHFLALRLVHCTVWSARKCSMWMRHIHGE